MHLLELTLMRVERFLSDYYAQFRKPAGLSAISNAFNRHVRYRLGTTMDEVMRKLVDAGRAHMVMVETGGRYFYACRDWERMSEGERIEAVLKLRRK